MGIHKTRTYRAGALLFAILLFSAGSVRPLLDFAQGKHSPAQHELFSPDNVLIAIFLPISKQNVDSPAATSSLLIKDIRAAVQVLNVACTKNSPVDVIPLSAYLIYTLTTSSQL